MKRILVLLIFIFSLNLISIENSLAQRDRLKANQYYTNYQYELAIPYYLNALAIDSSLENLEQLADCYRLTHQYKSALKYYKLAFEIPYYSSTTVFYLAEMLLQIGNYDEALSLYELYRNYEPVNLAYVESCIASCKFASEAIKNIQNVRIENLKEINTKYSESGIYIGAKNIYFSTDKKTNSSSPIDSWTGNSYFKIYSVPYTVKNNNITFLKAKPFNNTINAGYHASFPSFNGSENILFFTSTFLEENPKRKYGIRGNEFINRMNITRATLTGKRWTVDSNLNSSIQYSILHPCLNKTGTRLYFSSDMPGGYGSYDLYYCDIDEEGNISVPINMGNLINSAGMEVFPSYATDTELYYSTNGKSGFGGLDIYKAIIQNEKVNSIDNLGYPINSSYDDYSFVPYNTDIGFFCSDREGGKGKDDIYKVIFLK